MRVSTDYHVEVDGHYYSVPHALVRRQLDVRLTARTVECFHRGERVASHVRSLNKGRHTTAVEHMPEKHRRMGDWTPDRFIDWAEKIGPDTVALTTAVLARRHPQQAYRSCIGLQRLAKCYGDARLEAAAARALAVDSCSYRGVESILPSPTRRDPRRAARTPPSPSTTTTSAAPSTTSDAGKDAQMLTHPTVDKLLQLRCAGMAKALAEQLDAPEVEALSFEERLGLLVDRELTERHSRQLTNRLRRARLKHQACIEDIDFRHRRGLDRQVVLSLADGRWVREHLNILICGPTGIGKSWLACAFAHSACRHGHSALYVRVSRLLSELAVARADGRYPRRLESLAKTEVLVMDDLGLTPFSAENRLDLLEVLEDRHGVRSTVVTSQLPVDKWHDVVGDPTLGDAILDRLVHNAYKLDLKGDSMRKRRRTSTRTGSPDS